jgi:DNA mismatch repair protein MutL
LHTKGLWRSFSLYCGYSSCRNENKQEQELGTHIIIEGSKFVSQDVAVLPKGTSFAVEIYF